MFDINKFDALFENQLPDDRFQLVLEVLMQEHDAEALEEADFGYYVIIVAEDLQQKRAYESLNKLAQLCQRYLPLYKDVIPFFSYHMIIILLSNGEKDERIKEHFQPFIEDPATYIDFLLRLLDWLILYKKSHLCVELGNKVYNQVIEFTILDPEPEKQIILNAQALALFDNFQALTCHKPVDWEATYHCLEATFGIKFLKAELTQIQETFTLPFKEINVLEQPFQENKIQTLKYIGLGFYRFLYHKKELDFVFGQLIYTKVIDFLLQRKSISKSSFNSFFSFRKSTLENYVISLIGGLLSYIETGFVLLWGFPFVYQFLYETGVINLKILNTSLKYVEELKNEMYQGFADSLWKYRFIKNLE